MKGKFDSTDTKLNPYSIPLFAAFDHSMEDTSGLYHIYGYDGIVEAFTNEQGECSPRPQCAGKTDGYYNSGHTAFGVIGHYLGASKDDGTLKLQYEGHPGLVVITNLKQSPQWIYEQVYCQRGDIENRIKELHDLQIDRTSCSDFWANQFRVLLTAAAYVLMQELA